MKFGLTEEEYQYIRENVVEPLQEKGANIWCFGSRARGDHQDFSDLDLMVESSEDLSKEIGAIQERLSKSNFPYKVDLVQFSEFAESYKDGYFRDRVPF